MSNEVSGASVMSGPYHKGCGNIALQLRIVVVFTFGNIVQFGIVEDEIMKFANPFNILLAPTLQCSEFQPRMVSQQHVGEILPPIPHEMCLQTFACVSGQSLQITSALAGSTRGFLVISQAAQESHFARNNVRTLRRGSAGRSSLAQDVSGALPSSWLVVSWQIG